jgi:hypothetical protein
MRKSHSERKLTKKNKLVLRRESIKALDQVDLALIAGGETTLPPPDGGGPTATE